MITPTLNRIWVNKFYRTVRKFLLSVPDKRIKMYEAVKKKFNTIIGILASNEVRLIRNVDIIQYLVELLRTLLL